MLTGAESRSCTADISKTQLHLEKPRKFLVPYLQGVKVIHRTRELEEQQANSRIWNETWLEADFYRPCNYELFVKQTFNMEMAITMAREAGMDWIIHIDTDELLHPAGTSDYSVQQYLSDMPENVDMVVFVNYESTVERDDIKDPFSEVSMFKKGFHHINRGTFFGSHKKAKRDNPDYFLTYANGKSAARIQDHLRPNGAHRWHNYMKNPIEIYSDEAAVLHYTYAKFSDLTSRRDRCRCKPTKEGVKRCFMLEFDRNAFMIASTLTKEEMLLWYREHVVWTDKELTDELLKRGILTRIYSPMRGNSSAIGWEKEILIGRHTSEEFAKVGRVKELEASLQLLRGKDIDISQEAATILDSTRPFEEQSRSGFGQLLDRRYVRPLVVGIGLPFLMSWGGVNGVLFYASSVFEAAGCTVIIATTTIALIQIPFSVLGVLLMDKFGRRSLLMIDLAGVCLGGALAGFAFTLQHSKLGKDLTPTLVLVSMLIYFASFAFGAGLPFVIISEIFPTNIKGTAGSIAAFANCFSSLIVSYVFNFLFTWGSAGVFFIFAVICGLLILFVAKMLPETKGLSLEDIQALWTQELH